MTITTYTLQQSATKTPTNAVDAEGNPLLQEFVAAVNELCRDCVINGKLLLSVRGAVHSGAIHLSATGCDITTPKDVALRFLSGEAGHRIQVPQAQ